ncbi:hypothetical protein GGR34_003723 [Microvirga flocculans]|uniref:Uncharacterized protein n=1 Tax=Microvirga flocculans TaxID=217168 RepID=A0A7W6IIF1_9HYPH|nr:hypothetical protein [Microvirga flocculans]MBB4042038.1 hypothetical protein [Microvirga flocculans]
MERKRDEDLDKDLWLRRQALQIAIQLPESELDAIKVLDYSRELATKFLRGLPSAAVDRAGQAQPIAQSASL